jgi:hypothetical protein
MLLFFDFSHSLENNRLMTGADSGELLGILLFQSRQQSGTQGL